MRFLIYYLFNFRWGAKAFHCLGYCLCHDDATNRSNPQRPQEITVLTLQFLEFVYNEQLGLGHWRWISLIRSKTS